MAQKNGIQQINAADITKQIILNDVIGSSGISSVTNSDMKNSVETVADTDVTLSGEQTINGVLTSNSRIGVIGQSDASENGVYITASGSWTRADDSDEDSKVTNGLSFFVSNVSSTKNGNQYILVTPDTIILDTTNLAFILIPRLVLGTGLGQAAEGNDLRIPTQDENDALIGSNGSPSSSNKYLTASDVGIGIQAFDAGLASIGGLTTSVDKMIYTTASDTYAVTQLSGFSRTLLASATALVARSHLALGTSDSPSFFRVTLSSGLTLSAMTQGSIPFVGASGFISEDNTNLFWDNTSKTIVVGKSELGAFPFASTDAYFGHSGLNHSNNGNYALRQNSVGKTFVNSASGQGLDFLIAGAPKIRIGASSFDLLVAGDYLINSASVLNTTTLGSSVVNSSLTNVGTLTSLLVSGNVGIGATPTQGKLHVTQSADAFNNGITTEATGGGRGHFYHTNVNTVVIQKGANTNQIVLNNDTSVSFVQRIIANANHQAFAAVINGSGLFQTVNFPIAFPVGSLIRVIGTLQTAGGTDSFIVVRNIAVASFQFEARNHDGGVHTGADTVGFIAIREA